MLVEIYSLNKAVTVAAFELDLSTRLPNAGDVLEFADYKGELVIGKINAIHHDWYSTRNLIRIVISSE